jgi:cytochrome c peroxidase
MGTGRLFSLALALSYSLSAQPGGLASLKSVPLPQPSGLDQYVRDPKALAALGKSLFWDVQVGSDGQTACATCHFHAGADHRIQNQLSSPHSKDTGVRPNQVLSPAYFPFRKLADPLNNRSAVERDRRQVVGSAGVAYRRFVDVNGSAADEGLDEGGPAAFSVNGLKVRQVTARNTPSVINSVYYVLNFWDGRASNIFTGGTPFGDSDKEYRVQAMKDGRLELQAVRMENASLASQAVGPALNTVEMSYDGRTWPKLARKMLSSAPLALQKVSPEDSALGEMASVEGNGLRPEFTYSALVKAAFKAEYVETDAQLEHNFPLFFGLAVQAYESLLVSDDTRFDRFMDGDRAALNAAEQQGIRVFQGASECHECHEGPEFTSAAFTTVRGRLDRNSTQPRTFGFFRTGVSPIAEDVSGDEKDSFGIPFFPAATGGQARGVFKAPTLRNVELTGPYFHDGGQATLEQVVEFYARQGDFPDDGNLGPGMGRIRMNAEERAAVVALMKALTDDRVRFERAPFDHPALCVPTGHAESEGALETGQLFRARDKWALIPAVGKGGNPVPLQTFEELLNGIGADGTRAHTLTEACPE